jgi:hypothetical protein
MELGLHVFYFNYEGGDTAIAPTLARTGQVAEAVGLTWLSVMDHYFQMDRIATPRSATWPARRPRSSSGCWSPA